MHNYKKTRTKIGGPWSSHKTATQSNLNGHSWPDPIWRNSFAQNSSPGHCVALRVGMPVRIPQLLHIWKRSQLFHLHNSSWVGERRRAVKSCGSGREAIKSIATLASIIIWTACGTNTSLRLHDPYRKMWSGNQRVCIESKHCYDLVRDDEGSQSSIIPVASPRWAMRCRNVVEMFDENNHEINDLVLSHVIREQAVRDSLEITVQFNPFKLLLLCVPT